MISTRTSGAAISACTQARTGAPSLGSHGVDPDLIHLRAVLDGLDPDDRLQQAGIVGAVMLQHGVDLCQQVFGLALDVLLGVAGGDARQVIEAVYFSTARDRIAPGSVRMILAMMDSPGNGSGGSRTGVGWWPVFTARRRLNSGAMMARKACGGSGGPASNLSLGGQQGVRNGARPAGEPAAWRSVPCPRAAGVLAGALRADAAAQAAQLHQGLRDGCRLIGMRGGHFPTDAEAGEPGQTVRPWRSVSTTSPDCSEAPTVWRRPNR